MAVTVDGPKIKFKLIAQSPMIHFQADEYGATLRGSEVKPKLDRYLIRRMLLSETGSDDPKNFQQLKKAHPDFFIDAAHDALDYKIAFVDNGNERKKIRLNPNDYKIVWVNRPPRGSDSSEEFKEKKGIITNPEVTIICFNSSLLEILQKYIRSFFLVTNFGYMQDKGFGSFIVSGDTLKEDDVCSELLHTYGNSVYHHIVASHKDDYEVIFDKIYNYYTELKSGKNGQESYLRKYLRNHNSIFGSDKKKEKCVRVFMGKGEISSKSKNIQRVQSDIFFKVINGDFFVTSIRTPDILYGQTIICDNNKKFFVPEAKDLPGGYFNANELLNEYENYRKKRNSRG